MMHAKERKTLMQRFPALIFLAGLVSTIIFFALTLWTADVFVGGYVSGICMAVCAASAVVTIIAFINIPETEDTK